MQEAIDSSKVTGFELSKEELKAYIHKYLENGWISRAVKGSKAAGIELTNDVLAGYVNKYLDAGRIYSAIEASKTFGIPLPRDKLVIIGRECLLKGNLTSGLEAYNLINETPPVEELVICGNICLCEGQLSHGREAYRLSSMTPPEEELIVCGNRCFNSGWTTSGLEAYELAKKTPTKEMLRACAEICLMGKNIDEARRALVAAQKIEDTPGSKPIEITEISLDELGAQKDLEASWKCLVPRACMDCKNYGEFKERFFILSRCPEKREEEEWLDNTMKEQYGIEHYAVGVFRDNRGLIDSAVCKECGSQNVAFDS